MLETALKRLPLSELTQLGAEAGQENARYMKPAQFKRLVENLRRDGALTSAPLVGRMVGDERLFVISGNHRVAAAIEAGIAEADCIEVLEPLSRERFTAVQLSHNAIEGEDDRAALCRLYDMLDLDLKEYSGLTDDAFDMDELQVTTITGVAPLYAEVVVSFLSDDAHAVQAFLKTAERWAKKERPVLVASYEDFAQFFDAIVGIKDMRGITNSAVAFATLVDLAQAKITEETRERTQTVADERAAPARKSRPAAPQRKRAQATQGKPDPQAA
jgi:ParB-like nuclease domain